LYDDKSPPSAAGVVGNSMWKGIDHFQNIVERFLKIVPDFAQICFYTSRVVIIEPTNLGEILALTPANGNNSF
jgi:hypothetical protein